MSGSFPQLPQRDILTKSPSFGRVGENAPVKYNFFLMQMQIKKAKKLKSSLIFPANERLHPTGLSVLENALSVHECLVRRCLTCQTSPTKLVRHLRRKRGGLGERGVDASCPRLRRAHEITRNQRYDR